MGFRMELKKQNNHLYYDFPNAYWSIDALSFSNFIDYDENGVKTSTPTVSFSLRAYPSRESKIKEKEGIQSTIGFGSSISVAVNPCIYEWKAFFKSEEIFGDSIPLSENGQKEILYEFIKKYTQLPFEDVFEE